MKPRLSSPAEQASAPRGEGDPGFVASMVLVALGLFCFTVAGYAESACITMKEFAVHGGKIVHTKNIAFKEPPWAIMCDRVGCPGYMEFEGIVDARGLPQAQRLTYSDWSMAKGYSRKDARTFEDFGRRMIEESRFAPPRVGGKPVCFKMKWRLGFEIKEKPTKK